MKIAFCVLKNPAFGGGIERYTAEVGSRLVRRGHDVRVYSMRHYGPVQPCLEGMRVVGVPSIPIRPMEKLSASVSATVRTLLDDRSDIVHFQHIAAGWLAWMSKLRGQRCVLQSHGLAWRTPQWGRVGAAFLHLLERLALRQCDVLTGSSLVQNRYYARRYGIRMVYIPSGAEAKHPVAACEILRLGLRERSYVLYVGRLSEEKGVHHLVPAYRRLATDCRLVVAGPPCGRRYYRRLHKLAGADRRILFTGPVRGRLLEELFSNAAVYVQPSQLEGLSLALLEAMSYGNCCLVSDIPENLEAIEGTGFHFRSGSVDSLAERLNWVLNHPDEALAAGQMARARVGQCYSWDRVTDRLEGLYRDLLGRRRAA